VDSTRQLAELAEVVVETALDMVHSAMQAAHATLLDLGLACTLDRRPRMAPASDALDAARDPSPAPAPPPGCRSIPCLRAEP
ncbi:hypothetical protein QUS34_22850, partial [Xanthomonas citri pv. citri]